MNDSIYINGTELPMFKKDGLEITREKVWAANTGRAANGEVVGDMIAIKTKIKCQWPPLSREQVAEIDMLVSNPFFQLTFSDPATNARKTITAYAGTPTYPVYSYVDGVKTYNGVSVDFIEK